MANDAKLDPKSTGDADLDQRLLNARDERPSDDFMARVLADAEAVQDRIQPVATAAMPPVRTSIFASVLNAVGGWVGASGITAAGVMGLAVGLYGLGSVDAILSADMLSYLSADYGLAPDLGSLWVEDGDV